MSNIGIAGRLLRVNLTQKTATTEELPLELFVEYIGGRGLSAYYLTKEVAPSCDPLGDENKLIFFNGPFAGSLVPGNNKINVAFKSPLSNTYSFSLAGGHFGPELRFAGYDGMIIEGKSEEPVYLWIDDDKVEIRSAANVWGQDIKSTDDLIRQELGADHNIHVACIGPAGENLVKYASITADVYREFGRGGCGTVMGAKNLKAIAVRGTKDVAVADPKGLMELAERAYAASAINAKAKVRRLHGTNELVEHINNAGFLATRNFAEGFAEEFKVFEGASFRESVVFTDAACFGCQIACSKNCRMETKEFGTVQLEGPEFETLAMLGTNCGLTNWENVMKVSEVCDMLGMDSMSAGGCIALAMECFEKGILTVKDTDGLELNFGNGSAEVKLLRMIAYRQGIGAILAEGPVYAAQQWGVPDLAMQSKGMAFAAYDPRGAKGMALTYATSPKGAHHMVAPVFGAEMAAGTRFEEAGKENMVKGTQLNFAAVDSFGICATCQNGLPRPEQLAAFKMATGYELTEAKMLFNAERIFNMERMFNVANGFSRKNDTLPKRFTEETMTMGASKDQTVDLESMLDAYYAVMGWDNDGIPTPQTLNKLGLDK